MKASPEFVTVRVKDLPFDSYSLRAIYERARTDGFRRKLFPIDEVGILSYLAGTRDIVYGANVFPVAPFAVFYNSQAPQLQREFCVHINAPKRAEYKLLFGGDMRLQASDKLLFFQQRTRITPPSPRPAAPLSMESVLLHRGGASIKFPSDMLFCTWLNHK